MICDRKNIKLLTTVGLHFVFKISCRPSTRVISCNLWSNEKSSRVKMEEIDNISQYLRQFLCSLEIFTFLNEVICNKSWWGCFGWMRMNWFTLNIKSCCYYTSCLSEQWLYAVQQVFKMYRFIFNILKSHRLYKGRSPGLVLWVSASSSLFGSLTWFSTDQHSKEKTKYETFKGLAKKASNEVYSRH